MRWGESFGATKQRGSVVSKLLHGVTFPLSILFRKAWKCCLFCCRGGWQGGPGSVRTGCHLGDLKTSRNSTCKWNFLCVVILSVRLEMARESGISKLLSLYMISDLLCELISASVFFSESWGCLLCVSVELRAAQQLSPVAPQCQEWCYPTQSGSHFRRAAKEHPGWSLADTIMSQWFLADDETCSKNSQSVIILQISLQMQCSTS